MTEADSKKIIVVSTRPPKAPFSGGMVPAVMATVGYSFDEVLWIAVGDGDSPTDEFKNAADPSVRVSDLNVQGMNVKMMEYNVENIQVKQLFPGSSHFNGHYNVCANEVQWPLGHDRYDLVGRPSNVDTLGANIVNYSMAQLIANILKNDSKTPVWIQDYHHYGLPEFMREHGLENPIVVFSHIPMPNPDRMDGVNEEAKAYFSGTLEGLQHANAVIFQTDETARRFMKHIGVENPPALAYYEKTEICVSPAAGQKKLIVGNYPISIDMAEYVQKAVKPLRTESAKKFNSELVAPYAFVSFDRADYSKSIKPRLLAFERLLTERPDLAGKVQMGFSAEPTRRDIAKYVEYAEEVGRIAARINENPAWRCGDHNPVVLLPKHIEHDDVLSLMRQAEPSQRRIGIVTSYRDGMNLVAKEFAAVQDPDKAGVLILSAGTGAAVELDLEGRGAVVFNPDGRELVRTVESPDDIVTPIHHAMLKAINMPQAEANARARIMQEHIAEYDLLKWADEHAILMTELQAGKVTLKPSSQPQEVARFLQGPVFGPPPPP